MRKLNDCRIVPPYPFGIPTLRGYPSPVAAAHDASAIPLKRRVTPVAYVPPEIRSRTYRRLHDCLFIPNFETVAEVVEARRLVYEYEALRSGTASTRDNYRVMPYRRRSRYESRLTSPLAIGFMLAFIPPLAVSFVWSSKHFEHPAKIAITVYGMFTFVALLVAGFLSFT